MKRVVAWTASGKSPDGTLQESGGIVWRLGDGWNWGRGQAGDDPRFCYLRDADYVSGAALMVNNDRIMKHNATMLMVHKET